MRVALLTTNLQPDNGWATVTVRRGAALMSMGVEVVALTAKGDKPPMGITPTDVRPVLPRLRQGTRGALAILLSNGAVSRATADCDLIDAVSEPYALGCIQASLSRPLVVTSHGSYIPLASSQGITQLLYRLVYRRAHIAAVSDYTARRVASALHIPPPEVVLSGVDYDFYQVPRPRPEKRGPTVLCVGVLKKRKGIHTLIDAIARVRQTIPNVQCVLAGSIPRSRFVRLLKEKIARYGLQEHVLMAGRLPYEEIVGWYQTADVFAMPSVSGKTRFEGFSLVHLEANACGLPAIGTRNSGNESAIVDGETGFLIEQSNPEILANRLIEVLSDSALRDRLSRGARAFAQAHTWQNSAAEILAFYQRALDGRAHRETD